MVIDAVVQAQAIAQQHFWSAVLGISLAINSWFLKDVVRDVRKLNTEVARGGEKHNSHERRLDRLEIGE